MESPMPKPSLALAKTREPSLLEEEAADPKTYEREVRVLLLHAFAQTACVLRPYPKELEAQPANLAGALEWMRGQGLIHGTPRDPNLTAKGRDLAERISDADAAKIFSAQGAGVAR
jgi:hypothetical protein